MFAHGYSFEGVVLNRRNANEADKVITFFTREKGKIALKAKGIRRLNSKRAGTLELFNRIKGSAVIGKGQLDTLTEVAIVDSYSQWKGHFGRINLAYQMVEAIDRLTPDSEPHEDIYNLLIVFLQEISKLKTDWSDRVKDHLVQLVILLGYWPEDKPFLGDIYQYIESVSGKKFSSEKILKRVSEVHP